MAAPIAAIAAWYDGRTAIRHDGTARADGTALLLERVDGSEERIAASDLTWREGRRDSVVYGRHSVPDFRLILGRDIPEELERILPGRAEYGRWIDRFGLGKTATAFAVISVAVVALVMAAPGWLGPRVPESWERRMGDAMIGDLGNRLCSTPESKRALAKMVRTLDPSEHPVHVGIVNLGMVNAVALPGEHVMLFDGLVREAETPDELAAVLAHEIGHVRERHVMTAMMRQFGLSILASGLGGGVTENLFGLASLSYSREAERDADAYARARLNRTNISPLGAARFFERIRKDRGDDPPVIAGWLASHPAPEERADAFRDAARENHRYADILTAEEFVRLKKACSDDPDVKGFDVF